MNLFKRLWFTLTIFEIILTSTVITTAITTIFNVFKTKKEFKISGITQQRNIWRKEIREIADVLSVSRKLEDKKKAIGQLKVRINPFGYGRGNHEYTTFDFDSDVYIWDSIEAVEKNKYDKKSIEKLIIHLSVLLKHDWERSKKEVLGESIRIKCTVFCIFYYLISLLSVLVGLDFSISELFRITNQELAGKSLRFLILLIMLTPFFPYAFSQMELIKASKERRLKKYISYFINFMLVFSEILSIAGISFIIYFGLNKLYQLHFSNIVIIVCCMCSGIPLLLIFLLSYSHKIEREKVKYIRFINKMKIQ